MSSSWLRTVVVLSLVGGSGMATGCSAGSHELSDGIGVRMTPGLLFGHGRSAMMATRIGRADWPATDGPVVSIEETTFIERFVDIQGNASHEQSYPRRTFISRRVGAQIR